MAGTAARPTVDRPKTVGFIAAGNVAGAGIHEVAIALICGARVTIKTASAEPVFFAEFARTLAEIDGDVGARIEVVHWNRARTDLTAALIANCERVVAYGDDATIESLHRPNVIGFGSRVSAALIAGNAIIPSRIDEIADMLARDATLFEQLGCLSLHQVFVVSPDGRAARELAIRMSAALERIASAMPPARIPIRDAAEIRGVRERARWRAIAGEPVELFEGRGLEWTLSFRAESRTRLKFRRDSGLCMWPQCATSRSSAIASRVCRDGSRRWRSSATIVKSKHARWGYRTCARPARCNRRRSIGAMAEAGSST